MKIKLENGSTIESVDTDNATNQRGVRSKTIKFYEDDDSRECALVKMANKLVDNPETIDL